MQNSKLILSEEQVSQLAAYCDKGDAFLEQGDCEKAEREYGLAWDILPEPKIHWQAAATVLAALGDCYWFGEKWELALETFQFALLCEGAIENPYLHFRLAQCYLSQGEQEKAADEFKLAKNYASPVDFNELLAEELTVQEQLAVKALIE